MNGINQLFSNNPKDLLPICLYAGTPTLKGTVEVIRAPEKHGVNMVEIGIPLSDPMTDGIVIQNIATQTPRNKMSFKLPLGQLHDTHQDIKIPLTLMGYLNPIMQFGSDDFYRRRAECGIDGVIIPDLSLKDYQEHFRSIAGQYDIKVIILITPETSEERVHEVDKYADGFIYMISSAAITGAQQGFDEQKHAYFRKIEEINLCNPRMISFGISNRAVFHTACDSASGVIIGSRFVTLPSEEKDPEEAILRLIDKIKQEPNSPQKT